MIRVVSITATACLVGAATLLAIDAGRFVLAEVLLVLLALCLGALLAARRLFLRTREIVAAVHTFVTGDVRHARIAEVGEPEGFLHPTAETTLEVEGDDGHVHRIKVEMPVPFPAAIGYRLGRRWRLPIIGRKPLSELMALELRREGLKLSAGWRPDPAAEVIEVGAIGPGT